MFIYPDRKSGELTGRFRVEVMVDGKRKRGRANSLPERRRWTEGRVGLSVLV